MGLYHYPPPRGTVVRIQTVFLGDIRMKKRSGLLSAVSILLVIALVAGIGGSLIA